MPSNTKAVIARATHRRRRHGLNSSRVVLSTESQGEFKEFQAYFFNRLKPTDEVESELVREIVNSPCRLRRIELMEAAFFKKALRQRQELLGPDADPAEVGDAAFVEAAESKTMRTLGKGLERTPCATCIARRP